MECLKVRDITPTVIRVQEKVIKGGGILVIASQLSTKYLRAIHVKEEARLS